MNLYCFEFSIEQFSCIKKNIEIFVVQINCQDSITFSFKYNQNLSTHDPMKHLDNGKAIMFSSLHNNLVSIFSKEIKVIVTSSENSEPCGTATIFWINFSTLSKDLKQNNQCLEHKDKSNLIENGKTFGSMQIHMRIINFGPKIEVELLKTGSRITIPTARVKPRSSEDDGYRGSMDSATWAPLFLTQKKQRKSDMDPIMEIYAQMAGLTVPEPIESRLTPDYINEHLCGHKACPAAIMFKQYGLGPLAQNCTSLGTITSIRNVKPQGLYGMSQAYGTMDSYGAYGFFVKKKDKKKKTSCLSPDCPYTDFLDPTEKQINSQTAEIDSKKCQCKKCSKFSKSKDCITCCESFSSIGTTCPFRSQKSKQSMTPSCCI